MCRGEGEKAVLVEERPGGTGAWRRGACWLHGTLPPCHSHPTAELPLRSLNPQIPSPQSHPPHLGGKGKEATGVAQAERCIGGVGGLEQHRSRGEGRGGGARGVRGGLAGAPGVGGAGAGLLLRAAPVGVVCRGQVLRRGGGGRGKGRLRGRSRQHQAPAGSRCPAGSTFPADAMPTSGSSAARQQQQQPN